MNDVANDRVAVVLEKKYNLNGKIQCFDDKTEILTEDGWKTCQTISMKDRVYSLNLTTNVADYYPITNIFKYNYNGLVYNIKNARLNFIFSPNHRLYYKKEVGENTFCQKLCDIIKKPLKKHTAFITCSQWKGIETPFIVLEKYLQKGGVRLKDKTVKFFFKPKKELVFNMDDWCSFLGWYLSEGCLFINRKDSQISITQTKVQNLKEIETLLKRMNISFWRANTEYLFNSYQIKKHLLENCSTNVNSNYCYEKKVPSYIKKLPPRQIRLFLDAFNRGDGWRRKSEFGYCTTSKQLADDIQELILKCNHGVSYHVVYKNRRRPIYIIHELFSKSASVDFSKNIQPINYNGVLWDIETKPHHTVLIRRSGRIIWTGNSIQWSALGVAGLVVAVLGAWLADKFSVHTGYRIAYAIMLIVPFFTIYYLKRYYVEKPAKKIKKYNWGEIFSYLKQKKMFCALLFIACFQLSPSFGTALTIKAREELMVGKMFLGYLGATGTVLGLVGYGLYYWKCHKYNIKKMLIFTILFTAITNLFYLYIPNQWYLLGYGILFGAFSGITFLTLLAFFAKITPNGYEGMIYAFITSLSNLCGRGGGFLGGIIYDHFGYSSTVWISSIFTLFCLIFIPFLTLSEKK